MNMRKGSMLLAMAMATALVGAALLVGCAAGGSSASSSGGATASKGSSTGYVTEVDASDAHASYAKGKHHAVLNIEGYDPVTIELDADAAPVSVWNFCKLADEGYYDGKTFYRFVDGFCMQGGTLGNSASGQDASIDRIVGEFSSNGVDNALADDFEKGVVAMARTSDPNSAGSTFFITLGSDERVAKSLNGLYAAFGTIDDKGMAVIDQVVADFLPKVSDNSKGVISSESDQAKITSIDIID